MTPHGEPVESLVAAIRAEEMAQAAHRRLDRMNGSIDRLGNEVAVAKSELSTKLDGVLLHLAQTAGFEIAHKRFLDSRRFVITTIVALVSLVIGASAALAAVLLTSH